MRYFVIASMLALLTGCGGGGGSDLTAYLLAIARASAKEAESRQLAVDTPCNQVSQCGTVSFVDPKSQCPLPIYVPYSLVSPTATAGKAAADQQRELAALARALSQQPLVPCPAIMTIAPNLACVASKCQAAPLTPTQ
jgi:hypothetical protein